MTIKPTCRMCHKELQTFGGLLFSPPENDFGGVSSVVKSHICKDCYEILTDWIMNRKTQD